MPRAVARPREPARVRRARPPSSDARSASSASTRSSAAPSCVGSSTSRPVRSCDDRVAVAGDARRDRGRAARGGLGDRHAPALVRRRAREHPRAPVEIEQRRVVDPARQRDPVVGAELAHLRLERLALVALADDHRAQRGLARPCTSASASISTVEALHRHEPADRDDERRRRRARRRARTTGRCPGGTTVMRFGGEVQLRARARRFDDSDSVTIGVRR